MAYIEGNQKGEVNAMKNNSALQSILQAYVDQGEIAGIALRVRFRDEIVFDDSYGYADIEMKRKVSKDTIFRLASMTKPIIAIGIMILVEEGKLRLDDPLSSYLSSYSNMHVEGSNHDCGKPITIRTMLNHSSGMGERPGSSEKIMEIFEQPDTLEKRVEKLSGIELDFEPGTDTGYSALWAYEVLGRIIEIVSELELDTFLRKKIFEPLGITDIIYTLTEEQVSRMAKLYEYNNGSLLDVTQSDVMWKSITHYKNYYSGTAGLKGSIAAYDQFVRMLFGKGSVEGKQIVSKQSMSELLRNSGPADKFIADGIYWGLGMIVFGKREETGRFVGEGSFGWSGAYGTHFYVDPAHELQMVLMVNRSNIGGADSYISKELERYVYRTFVKEI